MVLRWPPLDKPWAQAYDPLGAWWLSTVVASLPVIVLLGTLALFPREGPLLRTAGASDGADCRHLGLLMSGRLAGATAVYGAGYELMPIGWIMLNVLFMYQLTTEADREKLQELCGRLDFHARQGPAKLASWDPPARLKIPAVWGEKE